MTGSNSLIPTTVTQLYPSVQEMSPISFVCAVVGIGQHKQHDEHMFVLLTWELTISKISSF